MKTFNLFIPITKVDEEKRLVYGLATAESVDKSGEIFDYASSLPYYKDWSGEIHKASGGKSLGNVREMHTNIAAGKLTQINFNDEQKQIEVCAKIVNDSTWEKVLEGVLTGFSHGGEYIKTWKDPENPKLTRYTARPAELSVVDNPCLGAATFELLRADGATEMRKFKTQEPLMTETVEDGKPVKPKYAPVQKWEASDGKTFEKKEEWRVYQLGLETAAADGEDPARKVLADLAKAVEDKESKPDDEEKPDGKAPQDAEDEKKEGDGAPADDAEKMAKATESDQEDLKKADQEPMEKAGARISAASRKSLDKAAARIEEAGDHLAAAKKHHGSLGDVHKGLVKMHSALNDCMKLVTGDLNKADDAAQLVKDIRTQGEKIAAHLSEVEDHLDKSERSLGKMAKAHDGLEAAHDAATQALGEVCADTEKADDDGALQKAADENTQLKADIASLTEQNTSLQKTVDEFVKTVPDLTARIKKLEAQPLPAKGALFDTSNTAVISVQKGHEAQKDPAAPVEAPPISTYGASPEQMRQIMGIKR